MGQKEYLKRIKAKKSANTLLASRNTGKPSTLDFESYVAKKGGDLRGAGAF